MVHVYGKIFRGCAYVLAITVRYTQRGVFRPLLYITRAAARRRPTPLPFHLGPSPLPRPGAYLEILIYYSSNVSHRRMMVPNGVHACTYRKFSNIVPVGPCSPFAATNSAAAAVVVLGAGGGGANKLHGSTAKPDIKQKPYVVYLLGCIYINIHVVYSNPAFTCVRFALNTCTAMFLRSFDVNRSVR